ncbi:MAG: TolC family protein, partial [Synechocystis sp.]|nr:TolC family protein [Synechocystis sp.]
MKSIRPLKRWSFSSLLLALSTGVTVWGGHDLGVIAQTPGIVNPITVRNQQPAEPLSQLPAVLPAEGLNPAGNPLLFPTQPQEVDTTVRQAITLEEAIALALRNNENLRAANLSLEQQQAGLIAARAALYPRLDTDFSLSRDSSAAAEASNIIQANNGEELGFTPNPQSETSTNAVGNLNLTYNIYTGGNRGAQIAKAEQLVQNARLQVEVIAEQTRFDATDRYYALQGADA